MASGDIDTVSAAVDEVVEALVAERNIPKWRIGRAMRGEGFTLTTTPRFTLAPRRPPLSGRWATLIAMSTPASA